jgi:hypothetical protein
MRDPQNSEQMRTVREHVEAWRRQGGGRGSVVPERLWREAAGVARVEGVWATAQALRLNYERLRDKVAATGARQAKSGAGPGFIDLGTGVLGRGGKTVLELARRDGECLRIDVSDGSGVDVVALARALWSGRP